ncbi:MAG: HAD-IC family P-type ATPase, partial [Chloroflexota bacterium]|nr:HAD-IC family P-type ATPase [Chloroflexota bacterium]
MPASHGGGGGTPLGHRPLEFRVSGMDCADCARRLERGVGHLPEVDACSVNFGAARLRVRLAAGTDPDAASRRVAQVARSAGYELALHGGVHRDEAGPTSELRASERVRFWQRNRMLQAALVSGLLILLAWALSGLERLGLLSVLAQVPSAFELLGMRTEPTSLLPTLAYAGAIVLGGRSIARSGVLGLLRTRTFDINLLMTLAVLGAVAINQWAEGAVVVFLFSLGEGLESLTMDRTRGAIQSLMELAPKEATLKLPSGEIRVPVGDVAVGDVVAVRPGELVPVDGTVVEGASTVNQASITGESLPVEKARGDDVFAGTLNERGYLEARVSRSAEDSTLSRIIHMVEEAQGQKASSERFVDRFAAYYTPAVLLGAVLVALVPPLLLSQP